MNGLDIVFLALAGVLVVLGLVKGLVRILVGLGALVAAFVLASRFHDVAGARLHFTGWSEETRGLVGYVGVFFGVLLAGALLAWLLRKLVKAAKLGFADRLAGGAMGFVAAALTSAFLILPAVAYLPRGGAVLERSRLAPYVSAIADLASRFVPEDLARRYRERIESLRRRWRGEFEPPEIVVRMGRGGDAT